MELIFHRLLSLWIHIRVMVYNYTSLFLHMILSIRIGYKISHYRTILSQVYSLTKNYTLCSLCSCMTISLRLYCSHYILYTSVTRLIFYSDNTNISHMLHTLLYCIQYRTLLWFSIGIQSHVDLVSHLCSMISHCYDNITSPFYVQSRISVSHLCIRYSLTSL